MIVFTSLPMEQEVKESVCKHYVRLFALVVKKKKRKNNSKNFFHATKKQAISIILRLPGRSLAVLHLCHGHRHLFPALKKKNHHTCQLLFRFFYATQSDSYRKEDP